MKPHDLATAIEMILALRRDVKRLQKRNEQDRDERLRALEKKLDGKKWVSVQEWVGFLNERDKLEAERNEWRERYEQLKAEHDFALRDCDHWKARAEKGEG